MATVRTESNIVLENRRVAFTLSAEDASVLSVKTANGRELLREKTRFFALLDESFEPFVTTGLSFKNGVFTLSTELGEVKIAVFVREDYFVFEVQTALPQGAYC